MVHVKQAFSQNNTQTETIFKLTNEISDDYMIIAIYVWLSTRRLRNLLCPSRNTRPDRAQNCRRKISNYSQQHFAILFLWLHAAVFSIVRNHLQTTSISVHESYSEVTTYFWGKRCQTCKKKTIINIIEFSIKTSYPPAKKLNKTNKKRKQIVQQTRVPSLVKYSIPF